MEDSVQFLLIVILNAEVCEVSLEGGLDLSLGVEVSEVLEGLRDLFLVLLLLLLRNVAAEGFEKWVSKRFFCRQTLLLVNDEQFLNEIFRLGPDIAPELISKVVLTFKDNLLQALQCLRSEGRIAAHDDVEDDSAGPQVAFLGVIALDYLWCHVVRSTEELVQPLVRLDVT